MADFCKFKVKLVLSSSAWTWLPTEARDGFLANWESKPANDKWNFDPDDDDNQNCLYFKDSFFKMNPDKNSIAPQFTWSKLLKSKDNSTDVQLKMNDAFPVYWQFKVADVEKKGSFDGLFLDDPRN